MSLSSRNWFRGLAATSAAVVFAVAGGAAALADDVYNTVDATIDTTAEVMALSVGGGTGSTTLKVNPTNTDEKNGCNLTGATTLVVAVESSNSAVATVSPGSVTFTACGDIKPLTITPGVAGSTTISLKETSNNTGSTFNLLPATFTVNVAGPVKTATTTTVSCPASVEFDGTANTPCTATVTGSGGFSDSRPVSYSADNTNAGTVTASASYAATDTRLGSSDSKTFQIAKAPSTTTVTCPTSVSWTGSAQTPCSATVTGAGGLDLAPAPGYLNNTAVGSATASYTYAGDPNHNVSTDSKTFTIGKATSTVTVTCDAGPFTYTGAAQTPCSAKATGANGLNESLEVSYDKNTNAGTATASASYAGDTNHTGNTGSATFTIAKATSTVTVTCDAGPFTYTGAAQTPCSAKATGANGLNESLEVSYDKNTNAGTATFTIAKATSTVSLICTSPVTYTGAALEPCSAKASGAGNLDQPLELSYERNTNVGTATAAASYTGDANHKESAAETTFAIVKAQSATVVTCPAHVTYDGSDQEPCTAKVTGAGGLSQGLTVTYTDNRHAGTASASAGYGGDLNHDASSDSKTFEIDKAPTTTVVTCGSGSFVYTGSAITPCSASVTGAGGLSQNLSVGYANNTDAGSATASASFAGDNDHLGSVGSKTFTITKAPSQVTLTCSGTSFVFTGLAITPCSASVAGVGGLSQNLTVVYTKNTAVGTATATATYDGDANRESGSASKTFEITAWRMSGFYQPVDMGDVWNTVKAGSTVPLKFELFAGDTELTNVGAVKEFKVATVSCSTGSTLVEDAIELTTTGGTSLRYDSTGGQFIQNWQTPKSAGTCYRVTMIAKDLSTISALFKLK
jgi:hypothetical protein